MLSRLDVETRSHHGDVDQYWLDLMAAGVTREQYTRQLMRVYGFEASLECALAYTPNLVIADRREHTRSGLIAQDLVALGITPHKVAALPTCEGIAPFADPGEALGWKYVAERPTQLHSAIKRHLVDRLDVAHACSYLSVCDGIAAARWQQLGMVLDDTATRPGMADRIVDGARRAFACLTDWLRKDGGDA